MLNIIKSYFYGKRQFKISDLLIFVFGLFSDLKEEIGYFIL